MFFLFFGFLLATTMIENLLGLGSITISSTLWPNQAVFKSEGSVDCAEFRERNKKVSLPAFSAFCPQFVPFLSVNVAHGGEATFQGGG